MTGQTPLGASTEGASFDSRANVLNLCGLIEALLGHIADETDLVTKGRLVDAAAVASVKQPILDAYIALSSRMRPILSETIAAASQDSARLQALQDQLTDQLTFNLAVIGTARDLSENLVRSVAKSIGTRGRVNSYVGKGASPQAAPLAKGMTLNKAI